jgi:4-diphosphocytidyl-2-C-methyl-D-erythritol kinase
VRLPDIARTWFVLLKPSLLGLPGKTGRLYGLLGQEQYTKGEYTDRMKQFISTGGKTGHAQLFNVFDSVIPAAYPGLDGYRSIFSCAGAEEIHLAGSGPMLFTALQDEQAAASIHSKLTSRDIQSFLVESVPGS